MRIDDHQTVRQATPREPGASVGQALIQEFLRARGYDSPGLETLLEKEPGNWPRSRPGRISSTTCTAQRTSDVVVRSWTATTCRSDRRYVQRARAEQPPAGVADSNRAMSPSRSVRARLTRQRADPLAQAGSAEPPGYSPVQIVEGHTDFTSNFTARRAAESSGDAVAVAGNRTGYASCGGNVGSAYFQRM